MREPRWQFWEWRGIPGFWISRLSGKAFRWFRWKASPSMPFRWVAFIGYWEFWRLDWEGAVRNHTAEYEKTWAYLSALPHMGWIKVGGKK